MGNYRFKLSDMIPNAWFHKLKDMSRSGSRITSYHSNKKKQFSSTPTPTPTPTQHNQQQKQHISQSRRSYYHKPQPFKSDIHCNSPTNPKTSYTHFPDPPRKSSKTRIRRRSIRSSSSSKLLTSSSTSVSADCSCQAPLDSVWFNSDSTWSDNSVSPLYSSPETNLKVSFPPLEFGSDPISSTDQFKELGLATNVTKDMKLESIPELELPRILTKPAKFSDMVSDIKKKDTEIPTKFRKSSAKLEEKNTHGSLSVKVIKEERIQTFKEQKTSPSIRRLKLRANSPRIASKKIQAYSRKTMSSNMSSRSQKKNVSESFAIVKSSIDPQRDFRDSMVEMIVENNIRTSKDLEELLVCYLSLNSNEYHDLIVKVFEQIWFDLTDIEL